MHVLIDQCDLCRSKWSTYVESTVFCIETLGDSSAMSWFIPVINLQCVETRGRRAHSTVSKYPFNFLSTLPARGAGTQLRRWHSD